MNTLFARLVYVIFCVGCMIGFWFLVKFLVTGTSPEFSNGFVVGMFFIIVLFWICERLGAIKVIEPSKGEWIPHDH